MISDEALRAAAALPSREEHAGIVSETIAVVPAGVTVSVESVMTDPRVITIPSLARELLACREALRKYAKPMNVQEDNWSVWVSPDDGSMARALLPEPAKGGGA